jgi:serine/threonine protein kinase
MSKIRHPNVIGIMGAVIQPNQEPMLVSTDFVVCLDHLWCFYKTFLCFQQQKILEYMDHGSLHNILQNETMLLEADIILPMLRDISQGCRFLHASKPEIIHGDIKASNVLVDSRMRAKVADFG